LIHTLNDIQFRGLFGVDAVAGRPQGIIGVEESESSSANHYAAHGEKTPRKITSQLVSTNSCVRETPPRENALLEEPLIT